MQNEDTVGSCHLKLVWRENWDRKRNWLNWAFLHKDEGWWKGVEREARSWVQSKCDSFIFQYTSTTCTSITQNQQLIYISNITFMSANVFVLSISCAFGASSFWQNWNTLCRNWKKEKTGNVLKQVKLQITHSSLFFFFLIMQAFKQRKIYNYIT